MCTKDALAKESVVLCNVHKNEIKLCLHYLYQWHPCMIDTPLSLYIYSIHTLNTQAFIQVYTANKGSPNLSYAIVYPHLPSNSTIHLQYYFDQLECTYSKLLFVFNHPIPTWGHNVTNINLLLLIPIMVSKQLK